MKTDDRDERLGSILDRAVRDIDVSSHEAPVAQVRVVDRAGRVIAAVAAAAVFVGAVVFASAQFGRDTPPGADSPDTVIEGTLDSDKWQLERPPDWFTSPFEGCGTQLARGLIVSNVEFDFLNPEGEIPSCNERMVFAGFPSDGVAIDLEPQGARWGISFIPPLDTPFPIGSSQLIDRPGSSDGSLAEANIPIVVDGEAIAFVRLWMGPDASAGDLDTAFRILGSMRVDGGDRWIDEEAEFRGWPVGKSTTVRVNISRPEDWRAEAFKRPGVIDAPNPIVVLSSPLTDDNAQRACGPSAFFRPGSAPRVSSSGVAIAISDSSESWSYPKLGSRWAPIDPESATTDKIVECRGGGTFRWLQWGFAIDRRPILVDVLMGTAAQDDVAALMWASLDSLRFPEIPEPGGPPEPASPIRFVPSESWMSEATNRPTHTSAWTASGDMTAGEATFPDPADLSEGGILVTVFQVGEASIDPEHVNFVPDGLPLDLPEEIETSWEGYTEGRSRSTLLVAVNGRALQIHVYYGTTDPSEEMLVDAEAALERLIVDPVPAPPALPPPVRDEYRSEFVSDERGYRFWPRSGRAERGVVYRFEVPHCGLDWLVDFDGSFWEPIYPMPDSKPDYAINSDIGTITLVGTEEARYMSSTDEQVSLFRVEGPIVRQPCE